MIVIATYIIKSAHVQGQRERRALESAEAGTIRTAKSIAIIGAALGAGVPCRY